MKQTNIDKLVTEILAIEGEEAKQAGALGYMARALVQATLPHSKIDTQEFTRKNGSFVLTILANSKTGLPYGSIPRLLLAWMSTEAVRTQNRNLLLGNSLSDFMRQLDLVPSGGRWGTITRLKEQMRRLFGCSISYSYNDKDHLAIKNINPVSDANIWWNHKQLNQRTIFESTLTLNQDFFKEIISCPVPIDLRALKALKRSPLALDIYCWLTYRISYLKKTTNIPWQALQAQFGSNYSNDAQGTRNFKRKFLNELKKVHCIHANLKIAHDSSGLTVKPSKPHISISAKPC